MVVFQRFPLELEAYCGRLLFSQANTRFSECSATYQLRAGLVFSPAFHSWENLQDRLQDLLPHTFSS